MSRRRRIGGSDINHFAVPPATDRISQVIGGLFDLVEIRPKFGESFRSDRNQQHGKNIKTKGKCSVRGGDAFDGDGTTVKTTLSRPRSREEEVPANGTPKLGPLSLLRHRG
uniref:Uncharacterized protein n=1 Tax=Cannabis sativa TaxID=3483 RepID=A0A803QRR2_CANSA